MKFYANNTLGTTSQVAEMSIIKKTPADDTPLIDPMLLIIIIIGVVAVLAIAVVMVARRRSAAPKPESKSSKTSKGTPFPADSQGDVLQSDKFLSKSDQVYGFNQKEIRQLAEKINQLDTRATDAYQQGDYPGAIQLWNQALGNLGNLKIKAEGSNAQDLITKCESRMTEINQKIEHVNRESMAQIATYVKDVSNIRYIVITSLHTGGALAKVDLSKGEIDEDLFGGFLSAITSFKKEMTKKLPTVQQPQGQEGKSESYHEILSHGFNIIAVDGNFLRLSVISDDKLEGLIRQKLVNALFSYENIHQDELKYFDGNLAPFRDFEGFIRDELDVGLKVPSTIDTDQIPALEAPAEFQRILTELGEKGEHFYPTALPRLITNRTALAATDAVYYTYLAYQGGVFTPIPQESGPAEGTARGELDLDLSDATAEEKIRKIREYIENLQALQAQNENSLSQGRITREQYESNKQKIDEKVAVARAKLGRLSEERP